MAAQTAKSFVQQPRGKEAVQRGYKHEYELLGAPQQLARSAVLLTQQVERQSADSWHGRPGEARTIPASLCSYAMLSVANACSQEWPC
jgi:hypothetical protein